MRARMDITPETVSTWCNLRISVQDDLFIVLEGSTLGGGQITLLLSGQELGELEKAFKKIKSRKNRMRAINDRIEEIA